MLSRGWIGVDFDGTLAQYDFKRSEFPMFRSTVPTSSRGITLEDLRRFVRYDDEAGRINRRGDPASPGAGREPTGQ